MNAGVIFDLDGVLVDSEELHYRAYSEVLGRWGITVPREVYAREWIGAGRGPEYAERMLGIPVDATELRRLKEPVYDRILAAEARLMPGAADAVARMAARWPVALATNSRAANAMMVLDRYGLTRHFTAIVTRERYENQKPDPDAFLTAAVALGLAPERCVVVEDAEKGVLAAHRAGARCVAVPHAFTAGHDFSTADRVIGSLDELTPELVELLLR